MRPVIALALALVAACSPRAVTPSARTFVMDSPAAPPVGQGDAQVDFAAIGQMWGPSLVNGNGRIRRAVSDDVIVEGEAGILHVTNEGSGGDRNAYTGRGGLILHNQEQSAALMVGAGGGTSSVAGTWGSFDIGGVISGKQKWVRPVLMGDIGYSAPFDNKVFTVTENDTDQTKTVLRLPRNIVAKVGVGVELGARDACVVLGATMARFWLSESSRPLDTDPPDDEGFIAVGIGLRFQTD